MADLGGPQISALLESVPGIANVLRSPVADALVHMIRAGARLGDFRVEDAAELVQYAVRRGLIGNDEGDRLMLEVRDAVRTRAAAARARPSAKRPSSRAAKAPRKPPKAGKAAAQKGKRKR